MSVRIALLILLSLALLACGAPTPTRTPPTRPPQETATPRPVEGSPSPEPTQAVDPSLHVDGVATVMVDDVQQVVDPGHPNHNRRQNEELGTLSNGEKVFLVDQTRVKGDSYWQVARTGEGVPGFLGWIPQIKNGDLAIDSYQPTCPTAFPLTAQDLSEMDRLEALSCFGNMELTLSGTVTCSRPSIDYAVGGATFLDAHRSCDLDNEVHLLGSAITELLETPESVETITGNYLVRGHFDDPEAVACGSIPFENPGAAPGPPDPASVVACRQMFVVGSVVERD